jgi:hypothetical protein
LATRNGADIVSNSLIDMLKAVQRLLDLQLEHAISLTTWQQAWAELEMLAGANAADENLRTSRPQA